MKSRQNIYILPRSRHSATFCCQTNKCQNTIRQIRSTFAKMLLVEKICVHFSKPVLTYNVPKGEER